VGLARKPGITKTIWPSPGFLGWYLFKKGIEMIHSQIERISSVKYKKSEGLFMIIL
jgi:hypothetical protein